MNLFRKFFENSFWAQACLHFSFSIRLPRHIRSHKVSLPWGSYFSRFLIWLLRYQTVSMGIPRHISLLDLFLLPLHSPFLYHAIETLLCQGNKPQHTTHISERASTWPHPARVIYKNIFLLSKQLGTSYWSRQITWLPKVQHHSEVPRIKMTLVPEQTK